MAKTAATQIGGNGRVGGNIWQGTAAATADNNLAAGFRTGDLFLNSNASNAAQIKFSENNGVALWLNIALTGS